MNLRVVAAAVTTLLSAILLTNAGTATAVPAPSPACVSTTTPPPPATDPRWPALTDAAQHGDPLVVGIVSGQVVRYRISELHAIAAGPLHTVIVPDGDHKWLWLCP